MAFGDLLEKVGSAGPFQLLCVLLLTAPALLIASHNLVQNFSAASPEHQCCPPPPGTNASWVGNTTAARGGLSLVPSPERCCRLVGTHGQHPRSNGSLGRAGETEPCRDGWHYDRSTFSSTIVTEWDLVCDLGPLPALAQTLFMAGVLLGALLFGVFSDRFGRRVILLCSLLLVAVMGTGAALSSDFLTYCAFRLLSGVGLSGFLLNYICLSLEWVPTKSRALVVTWLSYCSTAGQVVLAGLAYGIRDWRWLQLAISIPFFIFFLCAWWIPESARWLIVNHRPAMALSNLQRVARINRKQLGGDSISLEMVEKVGGSPPGKSTCSCMGLFRTPAIRRISCCLMSVSFSTNLAYFGLSMDLPAFGLDIFLVQTFFGAIDILAKMACALALNYFGRRAIQASSLILAGVFLLGNIPVPREMLMVRLALVVLGKGCLAASSVCSYLYGGELFPTAVRQTGTGFTTMMARLGGMVAPVVLVAGQQFPFLPLVIFGVAPVVSGIAACFLPETHNVPLLDTIEEVENRYESRAAGSGRGFPTASMAPGVQLEKEQRMGFFQTILVALVFLPLLMVASHNFLQNFTAAVPRHWCYIPAGDNDTTEVTGDLLKIYIPMDGNQEPDRCLQFSTPQWQLLAPNGTRTNATESCLDGWAYDRSVFNSTIITEWHLVCGQRALKDFAQSIYMAGVLVGSLVYGGLADRLGRRALLLWSLLQIGVMGTGAAFAPNLAAYCAFRFFSGMGIAGFILNGSSLTLEWIPSQFRAMVSTILTCSLTLGQLLLAGLAYAIRDWRQLQLASSVPFFLFFLYSWWIPESAHWLIVNHRPEMALRNLRRTLRLEMQQEEESSGPSRHSALELFRTAPMRGVTCCLMLAWFSNSFSFYHLALDLQRFGGISIFLVQLIFGAVDMPFRMLVAVVANRLGRRLMQAACLVLGGLFILASIPVPQDMEVLLITLTVLGKGLFSSSSSCSYLYTTELYPTVIRQTGLGVTNMMARLGAVAAPMVQMTQAFVSFLPLLLFGAVPITAGILVNCLPETLGVPLADTMKQVEDRARKKRSKKEELRKEARGTKKTKF
ncbi:Solute carrier family 22 member 6-B [Platysternon megacephalum]|uniref:Solute carrier family 22 member 6-B n=1 Tax=Platysternon megacephalum TaxID=55544 RepID=A0A4D9ESJ5_9SAUR|nr:Solute carrier family 22 member 6-B [Platysternon megacephalum]